MNWDGRFASIVRETEQSLERVKSQLQIPSRGPHLSSSAQSHLQAPMGTRPTLTSATSILKAPHTPTSRRRSVSFDLSISPDKTTRREGSAVVNLLTTRIRDQQKEIVDLQESVSSLQSSLGQQGRDLQLAMAELKRLQTKPSTSSAIESQLQQFKLEVRKEIDGIKNTTATRGHQLNNQSLQTFANELHSSKRLLRGDIDGIQEDLSSVKAKLRSQDSDVGLWGSNLREVERKQERIEKVLSRLVERQQGEEVTRGRHNTTLEECSTQLQRTRDVLMDLQGRLSAVEARHSSRPQDRTLYTDDLEQLSHKTSHYNSSSSSPTSRSSGTRPLFSTLKGSGSSRSSIKNPLRSDSFRRTPGELLRRPGGTSGHTGTNLHTSCSLYSDDEDTVNELSLDLSSDNDLSCDLDSDGLSNSLLSVGAL